MKLLLLFLSYALVVHSDIDFPADEFLEMLKQDKANTDRFMNCHIFPDGEMMNRLHAKTEFLKIYNKVFASHIKHAMTEYGCNGQKAKRSVIETTTQTPQYYSDLFHAHLQNILILDDYLAKKRDALNDEMAECKVTEDEALQRYLKIIDHSYLHWLELNKRRCQYPDNSHDLMRH